MMKKQHIILISVMMGLALLSLTAIQIQWLSDSIRLKEQLFNQSVTKAMTIVAEKIEKRDAFYFLTDYMEHVSTTHPDLQEVTPVRVPGLPSERMRARFRETLENSVHFVHTQEDSHSVIPYPRRMTSAFHTTVSLRCCDSIYDDCDYEEKCLEIISSASGTSLEPGVITKILIPSNTLNQEKNEIYKSIYLDLVFEDSRLFDRIDTFSLDSLITSELRDFGITLPFFYTIYKQDPEKGIEPKLRSLSGDDTKNVYKANLFPGNIFGDGNYFIAVVFPQKSTRLLMSMWGNLLPSVLMIFVLAFGFAYTIITLMKQKKLSEIKSDFINNMTHQLKTPIATIALSTEALKDPTISKEKSQSKRFLDVIHEENSRLQDYVDTILQTALLDRGKVKLSFEEFDLHEILEGAVSNINLQVEKKNGTVVTNLYAVNSIINADRAHLSSAISNLLDNANKYSPKDPKIVITTKNNKQGITLAIEDSGIGMKKDTIRQIFDKFYRVSTGNVHDVKGFGLGLNYVSNIIKSHGGTITVKSELNKGSRFEIFLPFNAGISS
ncbi:MAG: HAMP domain-containing histidine kinase [Bacteroidetes bacterium]|nr:HAMP domain-containing histidine kinase [Bacteroidota bacterium]